MAYFHAKSHEQQNDLRTHFLSLSLDFTHLIRTYDELEIQSFDEFNDFIKTKNHFDQHQIHTELSLTDPEKKREVYSL